MANIKSSSTLNSDSILFRYGRALLGGVLLSVILIMLGQIYTSGDVPTSRELLINQLFINTILVVSLQVFVGNTGIMSFGHLAFATIAGYIVAILMIPIARKERQIPDVPFGLESVEYGAMESTVIAVIIVSVIALILSFALTRSGQGAFAATIITLAMLEIVHEAALGWNELTAGGVGLGFVPKLEENTPIIYVMVGSIVAARLFGETNVGRWAKAAREDDVAANILGFHPRYPRMAALIISVIIIALGASLKVQDVGSMTPRLMFFELTLLTLAMLIVGGRRSVTGAILGVLLITAGNEFSRVYGAEWSEIEYANILFKPTLPQLFLGAVMLGTMLFRPDGLIKDWELDHLFRNLLRRQEQKPEPQNMKLADLKANAVRMLSVTDLTVEFGGFRALNKVMLSVKSNEIVGLIGPNGAGKTTLLNAITGFVHTTDGKTMLDDILLTDKQPHQITKAGIARTFQNLRLFKDLSVRENIIVAALATERLNNSQVNEIVAQLMVDGGLWEQRYMRAGELDYGNQRRLELARAAVRLPDFLLLDEPTSGMSDDESAVMIDHIRKMAQMVGAGVLVIDHDLHFITNLCDRVYVLDYGTLIAEGTPDEIRTNDQVRTAYLGSQG